MAKPINIEILYITGCPNLHPTVDLVSAVLEESGVDAGIDGVRITSFEQAKDIGFAGSPSIRINGMDIEPEGARSPSFGCRTYTGAGRLSGVPSKELVVRAIQRALVE